MARWSGEVEFDFVGGEEEGNFVATAKVVPMLTQLLATGDVEGAVRLYEGADAAVAAELVAQAKSLSSVSLKNLGQMFYLARDFASAAKVLELGKRYADAARLFEQGGDFAGAARMYEKENDVARAAAAYERAGLPDRALAMYQKTGPSEGMAECLSRQKRYFEAAQVYEKLGNVRAQVEMLRMVPIDDPSRVAAVKRLGDLLERFGHLAPAAQLLVETIQQVQAAQGDPELLNTLIRRLEMLGKSDQAQRVRAFAMKQLGAGPAQAAPAAAPQLPSGGGFTPVAPSSTAFEPPAAPAPAADPFAGFVDPFAANPVEAAAAAHGGVGPRPQSTRIDAYGHLKAIPIFGELEMGDMKDLYRVCEEVSFPPGATIIEQGEQGKGLTVIVDGSVQVLKVDGLKATPLATLSSGNYVGELSLLDESPTSARVVAQTPVRALFCSRGRFQQYLYTHEAAALRIFTLFTKTLAERLRQANKRS